MVRFNKITVIQKGQEFRFDHLAVFNEFRLEVLYFTLQPEKDLLVQTYNSHKNVEGLLECKFRKPKGQFEGICLAYGTAKAASQFVNHPTLRKVLEHWDTRIELLINLDTHRSKTDILFKDRQSSIEINARYSLIPFEANVESAYNAVAIRRQLSLPPRTSINQVPLNSV